jgi:hypothetical protein
MSDEIAAVPSNDTATYLGDGDVTDEEFDSWVKRSQADTDAVLEGWDAGVEFDRVDPVVEAEIVDDDEGMRTDHDPATCPACLWSRGALVSPPSSLTLGMLLELEGQQRRQMREYYNRERVIVQARGVLESQGFVVVDADAKPRTSGLILPTDDVVAWAKRTFTVLERAPEGWWTQYYGRVTIDGRSLQ